MSFSSFGQTEETVIDFPEKESEFIGGDKAMQEFISEHIKYPIKAIEDAEQGTVYVSFIIEVTGELSNIEIKRGAGKLIDREAKRLVKLMPKWKPGELYGKKIRTRCLLPIRFKL